MIVIHRAPFPLTGDTPLCVNDLTPKEVLLLSQVPFKKEGMRGVSSRGKNKTRGREMKEKKNDKRHIHTHGDNYNVKMKGKRVIYTFQFK